MNDYDAARRTPTPNRASRERYEIAKLRERLTIAEAELDRARAGWHRSNEWAYKLRRRVGTEVRRIDELEAELETALRNLDAARTEIARLNSSAASPT